jgi:hypothetical protein
MVIVKDAECNKHLNQELTTHLHLVPRSRMRGAIPPLPQYAFMACGVLSYEKYTSTTLPLLCRTDRWWIKGRIGRTLPTPVLSFIWAGIWKTEVLLFVISYGPVVTEWLASTGLRNMSSLPGRCGIPSLRDIKTRSSNWGTGRSHKAPLPPPPPTPSIYTAVIWTEISFMYLTSRFLFLRHFPPDKDWIKL